MTPLTVKLPVPVVRTGVLGPVTSSIKTWAAASGPPTMSSTLPTTLMTAAGSMVTVALRDRLPVMTVTVATVSTGARGRCR